MSDNLADRCNLVDLLLKKAFRYYEECRPLERFPSPKADPLGLYLLTEHDRNHQTISRLILVSSNPTIHRGTRTKECDSWFHDRLSIPTMQIFILRIKIVFLPIRTKLLFLRSVNLSLLLSLLPSQRFLLDTCV